MIDRRAFRPAGWIVALLLSRISVAAPPASAIATQQRAGERLPVSVARRGFTPEQASRIREGWKWEEFFAPGDASLYTCLHFDEFCPCTRLAPAARELPLEKALDGRIGAIRFASASGEKTLDEYLVDETARAQAMIVIHRGKIGYERYPGMRENDVHLTFSVAKTMVSLVISLLESDGKIDVQQTIGAYVPRLSDTAWADIKVIDVLNMASGLDVGESQESRKDPASMFGRFVHVIFNQPGPAGQVEKHEDVIRSARRLREPGKTFEYSSLNTQVLVLLAEAVEHRPWAEIFRDRVWSKMNSEGELQVFRSPDGVALGCGLVSIRLRDLARFGMLYTPSWNQAARERIVSPEIVKRIQTGLSSQRKARTPEGEKSATNSRQWDTVFPDGDFFKGGMHGQGFYVSPNRDLVIAWFSTSASTALTNYARHIASMYDEDAVTQPAPVHLK